VNVLQIVLYVILTPMLIASLYWIVWAFVDLLRPTPLRFCCCGQFPLLGHEMLVHDPKTHTVHMSRLCQPCKEVLP
jgi:hypothetical protein